MEQDRAKRFRAALEVLKNEGLISGLKEVDERVYTAYPRRGWHEVARALALQQIGGQCIPVQGVVWRMGRDRGGNLIDASNGGIALENLYDAKRAIGLVAGQEATRDLWTVGACARQAWRWISPFADSYPQKRRPKSDADGLYLATPPPVVYDGEGGITTPDEGETEHDPIGHHDCEPGFYSNATLWDCKAYYGTMLVRMAEEGALSLRPRVYGVGPQAKIVKGLWKEGERERLREFMKIAWVAKPLRNSLVGAALGTYKLVTAYASDKKGGVKPVHYVPGPGPFRRLGLVIVRTGQDLCHAQAEAVGSVYSTVDSVCVPGGERIPELWQQKGFRVEIKHRAAIDVYGFGVWGVYRAGEFPQKQNFVSGTIPYITGKREYREAPRKEVASQLYQQWL